MNQSLIAKFATYLNDQRHIDVDISLDDGINLEKIVAHKIVLAANSDFFDRLFDFNKSQNTFTIKVPSAKCAITIIKKFYGQNIQLTNYLDIFNLIKCQHLWMLPINIEELYDIIVPPTAYDLLLEVVDMLDIDVLENCQLIRCLETNRPTNYDQSSLAPELVAEWNKKTYTIVLYDYGICFVNSYIKKNIYSFSVNEYYKMILLSHNKQFAILIYKLEHRIIYPYQSKITKLHTKPEYRIKLMVISPNDQYVTTCETEYIECVSQYDLSTNQQLWQYVPKWPDDEHVCEICYSPDGNQIFIYIVTSNKIVILNTFSGETINSFKFESKIILYDIIINPTNANKFIIRRALSLIEIDTSNLTKSASHPTIISANDEKILYKRQSSESYLAVYNFDGTNIAFVDNNKILICDISSGTTNVVYKKLECNNQIIKLSFSLDNKQILFNTSKCCYVLDLETNQCEEVYLSNAKIYEFYENIK